MGDEGGDNGHGNRQTKMITDHHNDDDDDNHTDVDVSSTSTIDSGGSGNSGNSASGSGGSSVNSGNSGNSGNSVGEKGMSESLQSRILLFAQQVNIATLSLLSLSSPPHYYSHHSIITTLIVIHLFDYFSIPFIFLPASLSPLSIPAPFPLSFFLISVSYLYLTSFSLYSFHPSPLSLSYRSLPLFILFPSFHPSPLILVAFSCDGS